MLKMGWRCESGSYVIEQYQYYSLCEFIQYINNYHRTNIYTIRIAAGRLPYDQYIFESKQLIGYWRRTIERLYNHQDSILYDGDYNYILQSILKLYYPTFEELNIDGHGEISISTICKQPSTYTVPEEYTFIIPVINIFFKNKEDAVLFKLSQ